MALSTIRNILKQHSNSEKAENPLFFKTGSGEYAEHDKFLGISVPILRTIARQHSGLTLEDIQILLQSPYNEERLLALFILVLQYRKADDTKKHGLYNFYRDHTAHINNWNLVDASAHEIIGAYLFHYPQDENVLRELAHSDNLWERRIAIISTLYFIRKGHTCLTYDIAEILLHDTHDLIHKAVGWMLREAGKKDEKQLILFLDKNVRTMPRTMVRYAIEKLSSDMRARYMK